MKVIQVFNRYLNFGGEENSVNRIAEHLQEHGVSVTRFIRSSEEWTNPSLLDKAKQPFKLIYNKELLSDLKDLQEREQADYWLLHNILPVISVGVYAMAEELGVKVVQMLHNYRPLSISGSLRVKDTQLTTVSRFIHEREAFAGAWRGIFPSIALYVAYKYAKWSNWFDSVYCWVAVSKKMADNFKAADFYPDKLTYCRHSWNISDCIDTYEKDANTFLYLGRLLPEKGIFFLLDLFSTEGMQDYKLKIAGSGDMERKVIEYVENMANVEYLGWIKGDEKKHAIRTATAVLFPSLWEEPLSTVAYESYEQETCLISSDAGGMTEIVLDSQTGLVVSAGDVEEWSTAIKYLCANRRYLEYGRSARRWLDDNVSSEIWFERFMKIIE